MSTLWAEGTSCFSFAAAFSRAGPEMSAIRTLAPSLAKRMQVSRPIPLWGVLVYVMCGLCCYGYLGDGNFLMRGSQCPLVCRRSRSPRK